MQLWGCSLDGLGDLKMLEVPELSPVKESYSLGVEFAQENEVCWSKKKKSWKNFKIWRLLWHQSLEFAQPGFLSCFSLVFPNSSPVPVFWNDNISPVPLYVGSVWRDVYFDIIED